MVLVAHRDHCGPSLVAGESHSGGGGMGALWLRVREKEKRGSRGRGRWLGQGGRVKGSRRSSARNYQNTPPFLLFWVKLTTFN